MIAIIHTSFITCSPDINECSTNNGGCSDSCTNTLGSYSCSCTVTGYTLSDDKHNCTGTVTITTGTVFIKYDNEI